MSKGVMQIGGSGLTASLAFLDKDGNAAQPAAPPAWSVTDSSVVSLTVAADGMSAQVLPLAVGGATINVVAEGDPTPGVDTVSLSGDVQVLPEEIASGTITFAANA